jgi:hypothetical protein
MKGGAAVRMRRSRAQQVLASLVVAALAGLVASYPGAIKEVAQAQERAAAAAEHRSNSQLAARIAELHRQGAPGDDVARVVAREFGATYEETTLVHAQTTLSPGCPTNSSCVTSVSTTTASGTTSTGLWYVSYFMTWNKNCPYNGVNYTCLLRDNPDYKGPDAFTIGLNTQVDMLKNDAYLFAYDSFGNYRSQERLGSSADSSSYFARSGIDSSVNLTFQESACYIGCYGQTGWNNLVRGEMIWYFKPINCAAGYTVQPQILYTHTWTSKTMSGVSVKKVGSYYVLYPNFSSSGKSWMNTRTMSGRKC